MDTFSKNKFDTDPLCFFLHFNKASVVIVDLQIRFLTFSLLLWGQGGALSPGAKANVTTSPGAKRGPFSPGGAHRGLHGHNDDSDSDDDISKKAPEYSRLITIRQVKPLKGTALKDRLVDEEFVKRISLAESKIKDIAEQFPELLVKYVLPLTSLPLISITSNHFCVRSQVLSSSRNISKLCVIRSQKVSKCN